ncbi:MAG: hypothetical protein KGH63_01815, partial [Candidatus Micrarchaeota archaeon]|nr:hypothetical protein [Candidatus Micrarchaeota archaeon]
IFRRDFMLRHGAKPEDPAIAALSSMLAEIEAKLKPLDEKLKAVDLLTLVPHRAELLSVAAEINQNSREQLDEALKTKSGPIYELLKKRAAITRGNYERREEIARLVILVNSLPRPDAERLRAVVESGTSDEVPVSTLSPEQQQELVNLLGRIGLVAFVSNGQLTLDKKKVDGLQFLSWAGEVPRPLTPQQTGWVSKDQLPSWDENEKHMAEVGRKIQQLMAQSQAGKLDDAQQKEFDALQTLYLELRTRRLSLANVTAPLSVSLPPSSKPAPSPAPGEVPSLDLGGA